jgi:response regulator RpfG family c-di-GMP phosphodiesterase
VILFLSHICRGMENLTLQMSFNKSQNEIIHKLGEVVEFRSEEESIHVVRVSKITNIICESLGWSSEDSDNITLASVLHDLGKISISDSILYKPGKLDAEEFSKVINHTTVGNNLLKNSSQAVLKLAAVIALEHHEKWDGTGYPNGKKGKNISIHARIVSIADVYDALRSRRSYKQPWSRKEAFDYILSERGQQFDPLIVDCFVKCESEINFLFK